MRTAMILVTILFSLRANADRKHDYELSAFVGAYVFSEDSRLGTNNPMKTSLKTSVDLGIRGTWVFRPWLSAEFELPIMPTKTKEGDASVIVIDPRVHAVFDFMPDKTIQPFATVGVGMMTSFSSDKDLIGNGLWPDSYLGIGARYQGNRRIGLRVDFRFHLLPGREGTAVAPEVEFFASFFRTWGGPDPVVGRKANEDDDGDGIYNAIDKCPDEKEDKDNFEDTDGCPDLDNDQDGVIDANDKCPDQKESINGYKDDDGCRDAVPADVLAIEGPLPKVTFVRGKPQLSKRSIAFLKELGDFVYRHPGMIFEISVHVHSGRDERDRELSWLRAAEVAKIVNEAAVSDDRILTIGYGADEPADDGKNNRVTIKVLTAKELVTSRKMLDGRKKVLEEREKRRLEEEKAAEKAKEEAEKAKEKK